MVPELELMAARGEGLPDGLLPEDVWLFLSLRALYRSFRGGTISREQGKKEKSRIMAAYKDFESTAKLYRIMNARYAKLAPVLSEMETSDCGRCKRALRILDGRDGDAAV